MCDNAFFQPARWRHQGTGSTLPPGVQVASFTMCFLSAQTPKTGARGGARGGAWPHRCHLLFACVQLPFLLSPSENVECRLEAAIDRRNSKGLRQKGRWRLLDLVPAFLPWMSIEADTQTTPRTSLIGLAIERFAHGFAKVRHMAWSWMVDAMGSL
ncbi:unnamed protein product [Effrenium voratum]|uniref:Uncharacterized protein n=1 Tax=Effrenium voratum TaxID=2562239 RepID=A0AA36HMM2_9DINO|nr:unnamed protein product [Effrenium voratum]